MVRGVDYGTGFWWRDMVSKMGGWGPEWFFLVARDRYY